VLRLLPALVAMLLVFVGVLYGVRSSFRGQALRESWMALLYSLNWFKAYGQVPENNFLGHLWSLCIEEQFYLLWPFMLAGLFRAGLGKGRMAALVCGGWVASAAMRAAHWLTWKDWARVYHGLDSRADGLLTGCALALFLFAKPPPESRPRWLDAAGAAGLIALVALSLVPLSGDLYFLGGIPLVNLSVAALLGALLVGPPDSLLHRFLELRLLVWIGRVSYGLYLWHALVPHLMLKLGLEGKPWSLLLEIAFSFALAAASFYGLEIHFLKRKRQARGTGLPELADAGVLKTPGPQGP
jgi:peptidoglycan/LPS O-acetylase OafA/YrhL